MASSSSFLRQATALVIEYLRCGPHYVNMCTKPLDSDDWHISFNDVLAVNKQDAEKLFDRASNAEKKSIALMQEIERQTDGVFYKQIYRSDNWSHAYTLLKEFTGSVLVPQKTIARQRLDLIESHNDASKQN